MVFTFNSDDLQGQVMHVSQSLKTFKMCFYLDPCLFCMIFF